MKICFLAGANTIHSIRWIRYFVKAGEKITWISFAPPLNEARDFIGQTNFLNLRLGKNLLSLVNLPLNLWKIHKTIRREKIEIVHAHYAGLYGLIGALLNFHPFVLTVWGSDVLIFPSNFIKKKITGFILKKADLITVDGYNCRDAILKFSVHPKKVNFIQFGVDAEKFRPQGEPRPNTVLSLRSLEPIYDIETLIKAAPLVLNKVPETKFIIAGDGSDKQKLAELAVNLKVAERVQFVGRITHDKLPEFINNASIYVSTSLSDSGLAMSTTEAMACGLPVVITDTSDNSRWVKNNDGGFVIPVKNPELLAEKIIYLLAHPTERKAFGARNRKIVEEGNSYKGEMAKMHNIYKETLK